MKYRKKPIVIETVQYVECGKLVQGMCNSVPCFTAGNKEPHVHTIHDNQMVILEVGDWIIPEPDGKHFYPCKPDIFEQTYEKVEPFTGGPVDGVAGCNTKPYCFGGKTPDQSEPAVPCAVIMSMCDKTPKQQMGKK